MAPPDHVHTELDASVAAVGAVFQPVVELDEESVVGYEALAHGLPGTRLERPLELFAAARATGRLAELELACQSAAVKAAHAAGWGRPLSLFLNVEPEVIDQTTEPARLAVLERAQEHGPVVVELTERALTTAPRELLRGVDLLRELGCLIALDDVGADDRSLALMAFLRPDVVKLDLGLIHGRPSDKIAGVVHAVMAEADRSGLVVVAEGIETEAHVETARAFGATLGQGYRFGRPGPSAFDRAGRGLRDVARQPPRTAADPSPFALAVTAGAPVRQARKSLLLRLARQLEQQAALLGRQGVLLATFERAEHFRGAARRYAQLAQETAFVAVFAEGITVDPAPGVRGQPLTTDEPLRSSWDVAVVSPHFAAALVSQDLGDTGVPDSERRFAFAVVYDRPLAVAAARLLMARIQPLTA
jgi:EAL domain-containing protein (putative c-di-GMP-specific phosphodiesterase class I)